MFDLDRFIEDCHRARAEDHDHMAVLQVPYDVEKTWRLFEDPNLLLDGVKQ